MYSKQVSRICIAYNPAFFHVLHKKKAVLLVNITKKVQS